MFVISDVCRRLRHAALVGVFGCLLLSVGGAIQAQALPEDAPILISEANSTRALITVAERKTRRALFDRALFSPAGRRWSRFLSPIWICSKAKARTLFAPSSKTRSISAIRSKSSRLSHGGTQTGLCFERSARRRCRQCRRRAGARHVARNVEQSRAAFNRSRRRKNRGRCRRRRRRRCRERKTRRPQLSDDESRRLCRGRATACALWSRRLSAPTRRSNSRLRRIGYSTWLEEQMDEQSYSTVRLSDLSASADDSVADLRRRQRSRPTCPVTCFRDNYTMYPLQNWFYKEALYNEDQQLRRRVSWALSQILVVSGRTNDAAEPDAAVYPDARPPRVRQLPQFARKKSRSIRRWALIWIWRSARGRIRTKITRARFCSFSASASIC